MKFSHDIYAETNPAFCTCALIEFVKAFQSVNSHWPELPAVYLALPMALSGDIGDAFGGTNKSTGLLEWLERNPQVHVGLVDRVNASLGIVTEAVRFGCFVDALALTHDACLTLGGKKLKKKSGIDTLDEAVAHAIKHAGRLGYWFAMAGSTRNIFDIMGLTV